MRYSVPTTLQEAIEFLASGEARILAGGTDFYPGLNDAPVDFDTLDIGRMECLRGIAETRDGWRIGATTSWTDVVRTPLPACFDGLKASAREVGSIQIQNAGTVAGNLCNASPAADGVPPLLTLDASVEIAGAAGIRTLPLADFITGVRQTALRPGEIVTAVLVPALPAAARSGFRKLGARRYLVISIAMVGAVVVPDADGTIAAARVAVGSCSPVAQRLPALERALAGAPFSAGAMAARVEPEHLSPLSPIDDIRGTAHYRNEAVADLIGRTLADCCRAEGA